MYREQSPQQSIILLLHTLWLKKAAPFQLGCHSSHVVHMHAKMLTGENCCIYRTNSYIWYVNVRVDHFPEFFLYYYYCSFVSRARNTQVIQHTFPTRLLGKQRKLNLFKWTVEMAWNWDIWGRSTRQEYEFFLFFIFGKTGGQIPNTDGGTVWYLNSLKNEKKTHTHSQKLYAHVILAFSLCNYC